MVSGLDDVVHVKHRLAAGLVDDLVNLAAQLRQEGDAEYSFSRTTVL